MMKSILGVYKPALFQLLSERRLNKEDSEVYNNLQSLIVTIVKEAGFKNADTYPWMEDEMFSGDYTPKEVYEYLEGMILDILQGRF